MDDTKHLHIEFYSKPVENRSKSAAEGRPIFEDVEHVKIRHVGDKNRVNVAPAHEKFRMEPSIGRYITYAEAFPRHYEAFKQGEADMGEGTPISELPFLTNAKRAELKALNVHTAEALANLEGTPLQRLGMGARGLKDQAQAYIDKASDSRLETKLAAENAELRDRMERLEAQLAGADKAIAKFDHNGDGKPGGSKAKSVFDDMTVDDLKAFIKDRTGSTPKGNPKKETLVAMCEEVIEREREEAA